MQSSNSKAKTNRAIPILPVHSFRPGNNASNLECNTKSISSSSIEEEVVFNNDCSSARNYDGFPLVQSMMATEATRTAALTRHGAKQTEYPKSNTGWLKTLFVFEGRALDRIIVPWTIVTLNAVVFTILYATTNFLGRESSNERKDHIEELLELVLTTTMGFLLVFRLDRSSTRFWMARGCWGIIVTKSRAMVGSILLHGSHDPHHRDQAIRWIAAFSIASMNLLRELSIDPNTVEGVLSKDELKTLNASIHPPLHAADKIRFHLAGLFGPTAIDLDLNAAAKVNPDNNSNYFGHHDAARTIALSNFRTQQLLSLEQQLNVLIEEDGALARIKGTPLPLVYVTHLRTWLIMYLLVMPFFWKASMGYALIPVVCLAAFALLGLEAAAAEVEAPFHKDRTNHLEMDFFCLGLLSNVLQQTKEDALQKMGTKQIKKS